MRVVVIISDYEFQFFNRNIQNSLTIERALFADANIRRQSSFFRKPVVTKNKTVYSYFMLFCLVFLFENARVIDLNFEIEMCMGFVSTGNASLLLSKFIS